MAAAVEEEVPAVAEQVPGAMAAALKEEVRAAAEQVSSTTAAAVEEEVPAVAEQVSGATAAAVEEEVPAVAEQEELRQSLDTKNREIQGLKTALSEAQVAGKMLLDQVEELQQQVSSRTKEASRRSTVFLAPPGGLRRDRTASYASSQGAASRTSSVSTAGPMGRHGSEGSEDPRRSRSQRVHFDELARSTSPGDSSASDCEGRASAAGGQPGRGRGGSAAWRRRQALARVRTSTWEVFLREQQDVEDDLKRKVSFLEQELERREALESDIAPLISRAQTENIGRSSISAPGEKLRLQEAEEQIYGLRRRLSELGRETEQQSRASVQLEQQLRDRADEMEAKWIQSQALVTRLMVDLQEERERVEEANHRFSQLWRRSEEQRQELVEAKEALKAKAQTLEHELQQRSAFLMRRRTTARPASTFNSLAQELDRDPTQLEKENEELLDEVTQLRDMLSRAEMQIRESAGGTAVERRVSRRPSEVRSRLSSSGDAVDGGFLPRRDGAPSMDAGAAADIEALRAELTRTRLEVELAEARLRQQRTSYSQRSGGVTASSSLTPRVSRASTQKQPLRRRIGTDEPDSDAEFFGKPAEATVFPERAEEPEKTVEKAEPGWWERVASATVGIVCCREHRPLHQSNWVSLNCEDGAQVTHRKSRKVSFDAPPTPPSYNY